MTPHTYRASALVLALFFGCAGIDVHPVVGNEQWENGTEGFRYYMPVPYLLVSKATPSPVRIDFTKDKVVLATAGGQATPLELGKLVGLDPKQPITVAISDNSQIAFKSPDAQPPDGKQATVTALSNGIVQVEVVFAKLPTPDPVTITLTAKVDSLSLGSGTYEIRAQGSHNLVKSLGGAIRAGYTMSTVYLPDPTRMVAIDPVERIGGVAEVNFKLKDGWMLTEVGAKVDTQTDETINAVANVIKEVGSAAGSVAALSTARGGAPPPSKGPEAEDLTGLYRPVFSDGIIVDYEKINLRLH